MLLAQEPAPRETPAEPGQRKLPDGRSQTEAILKADFAKSQEDMAQLVKLAEEVRDDLERNERHVLSLGALKKLDEIEKISKRVRARMKRF